MRSTTGAFQDGPELAILVVASVCASAAFGWCLSLLTLSTVSVPHVAALWSLATMGVLWSLAIKLIRLPVTLRLVEFILLVAFGLFLAPSTMHVAVYMATWLVSLYLGVIYPAMIPPQYLHLADNSVESHLGDIRSEMEIYHDTRVRWALGASVSRSGDVVAALLFTALSVRVLRGNEWLDAVGDSLGRISAVAVGALLVLCSLVQLLYRRRTWDRDTTLQVDPHITRPWLSMLLGVTFIVVTLGLILPANISPLYNLDWDAIMNGITTKFFAWLQDPSGRSLRNSNVIPDVAIPLIIPSDVPLGGGEAGGGPMAFLFRFLLFGAIIYAVARLVWYPIRLFKEAEGSRARSPAQLLALLFRWPMAILRLMLQYVRSRSRLGPARIFHRSHRRNRSFQETLGLGARSQWGNMSIRRLFSTLLVQASKAGTPRRSEQTAHEFAKHLADTMPEVAGEIDVLAEAYQHVRYSPHSAAETWVQQVRKAWKRVVEALK